MSLQCRSCFWKKSCGMDSVDEVECTDFKPNTEKTFIEELLLTIDDAYENDGTVYDIKEFVDTFKPSSMKKETS